MGFTIMQPRFPLGRTRTPGNAASDPTNETMKQQTDTMILDKLKARAKRAGWAS